VGEASERLAVAQDEIADLLNEFGVERVAVLLPERDPRYKWLYETAAARASMETLFRLAAIRAKIAVEVLNREAVRSRLNLTGKLELHVDRIVAPAGKAWRQGRGEAALAAVAAERD
jgi:sugar phosphate isomerase/epimerase